MADVNSILARLLTSLTVSDPSWDVSIGSATYKILESVANEISLASNNSTLQTYSFDVYSKSGSQLDAFVNLFGISRQLGKRSVGTVVFSISSAATTPIPIPTGTQLFASGTNTSTGANVYFSTTSPALIQVGQTSVEVPVIASLPGSSGNVGINTITSITTSLLGYPTVTNYAELTGGTDTETDGQLQNRWVNTAFSNISGTTDKFESVALQDPNVTRVNVVGAQQVAIEQLQVVTTFSGNGSWALGLNTQAQLSVVSGATTGTLLFGSLPANNTVPSGAITASVSGIFPTASGGTIRFDGTNYNLYSTNTTWSGSTVSGTLNVNFTTYSALLSGSTTNAQLVAAVSGLLYGAGVTGLFTSTTGGPTIASGITAWTSQPTGYNLVASGATISGTNSITSQIPDSKYVYPAGGELLGVNLNTSTQQLYTNVVDYNYPSSTTPPLKITLNPNVGNAPNTYTGAFLELASEYIPTSSRITNPATNSNFIDIFIDSTNSYTVNEQVVFNPAVLFTNTSGNLNASNFIFANGQSCASGVNNTVGDYYISLSQRPVTNFPAQLVSGNAPSFISLGSYDVPISLEYVQYNPAPILTLSGVIGTNVLTTTTSISGLFLGLVASGNSLTGSAPFGTYITGLVPGNPNQVLLNTTLTNNFAGSVTWVTAAYPVYDITGTAGSILDLSGIGIDSGNFAGYQGVPFNGGSSPASATPMVGTFMHNYNSDVVQVNDLEQQSRVVGTNVLVHQAQPLSLMINLSVVYQNSVNIATVNNNIQTALVQYLSTVSYGGVLSLSAIANSVLNVTGVSSARVTTSVDNPLVYGVQSVALDGTVLTTYTGDILLANNQLPYLYGLNPIAFGVNNF
jgi:uncharacterized phage protein gp47/JayE